MKIGIVGCGAIGSRRVAHAQRAGDTVSVVHDIDPARATALAETTGARVASSVDDLVSATLDAVVVATTNDALAPTAVTALRAGHAVLCEKPLGRTSAEAGTAVAMAADAGRPLKVGFTLRHHAGVRALRDLVEGGRVGRVLAVRMAYGHGGRDGYDAEWRSRRATGGGQLLDQGIHLVDLLRSIAGPLRSVTGTVRTQFWDMEVEDNAQALIDTVDGATATLHTSCFQWRNLFRLEVIGDEGLVVAEGLGGSYGPERVTLARRPVRFGVPSIDEVELPAVDAWAAEWDDFRTAVRGGPVDGDGVDALHALAASEAWYRSSASMSSEPITDPTGAPWP